MDRPLILASGSDVRLRLLAKAGLQVIAHPARIDEAAVRTALLAEQASPRDVADTLAEIKARKIAERETGALVLGCDQVLDIDDIIFEKPGSSETAQLQLQQLSGATHRLHSAAVLYDAARPVWRHVGVARLTMHDLSDAWLAGYVDRNWDSIRHSVGGYLLEEEGVRLFSKIEGDYFTVLGLPLLPLLNFLVARGDLSA
jgi:septum formation protein